MRAALAFAVFLAACSGPAMTCEEYGDAVNQIVSDMTFESSTAEALIRQGAQRDFDETVSAELAVEFANLSSAANRLADLDALEAPPQEWEEASDMLREAVTVQEEGIEELGAAFAARDPEALGDAASKMARAFEILTQIAEELPDC